MNNTITAFLLYAGLAVVVLVVASLLDAMRPKNVAWRRLRGRCGPRPDDAAARGKHAAGRGRFGHHSYWGLRCFGGPGGLLILRLLPFNRPLFLPWSAISAIEVSPGALTGKAGFETDMDARIEVRGDPSLTVEVPWLEEFRPLLPKAIRLRRSDPATRQDSADVDALTDRGELDAAIRAGRKAVRAAKDAPEAKFSLARALYRAGEYGEALEVLQSIVPERANAARLDHEIGASLAGLGRTDEAIARFREAIAKRPDFALAHNSLGAELLSQGDLDGAIAGFRKALALHPDFAPRVHSNLLLTMNYPAATTQKQIYEESLQFDARHARKFARAARPLANARDPDRILRVGYVSPDFREHSVAFFTRELIGAHDREKVDVYCYADVKRPDAVTRLFERQADHWLSVTGMTDEDLARRIREDGIDILVDLAGHTSDNRLLVFARKPAPVQVTWLGYPNTTGMRAMGYRLTDAVADPPGESDRLHSEKLVRLAHGFLCYQPDERSPDVSPLPCLRNGHVTFGTFNTTRKVTAEVVAVWAQILQAIPGARLLIKSATLDDGKTKAGLLQMFAAQGIGQDRLDLLGYVADEQKHLKLYSGIDIGLDPFPYNGTTTTCDALWMGVPVIVLHGNRHAGRVGASILNQVGLPELVARDREEYVALACSLAADAEKLATLRSSLRSRMRQSPLMDLRLFTATLEQAYRDLWKEWCGQRP